MTDQTKSPFASDLLAGKRIVITGGGTGLGRGVAKHFVRHGAQVHLWGRRLSVLEEAAADVSGGAPGSAYVQTVDIRKADMVDAAAVEEWHGDRLLHEVSGCTWQ